MSTEAPGTIRILLADDHDFFREGMRGLLATVPGTNVVAEASSGEEAVALATTLQPDVVLMDLKMGGMNGIEATRQIVATSPHVGVLVLTMFEDDDWVFAAMKAGARGYLLKGSNQDEIVRAIRAVGNGEAIFSPGVARRLMRYFDNPAPVPASKVFPGLTERETEVLVMIAQGLTNQQIADRLFVSVKTVRNHVSNVLSKLQVADRAQAALRARDAGFGLTVPRRSQFRWRRAGPPCPVASSDQQQDRDVLHYAGPAVQHPQFSRDVTRYDGSIDAQSWMLCQ